MHKWKANNKLYCKETGVEVNTMHLAQIGNSGK
jgi:hypothetical protein